MPKQLFSSNSDATVAKIGGAAPELSIGGLGRVAFALLAMLLLAACAGPGGSLPAAPAAADTATPAQEPEPTDTAVPEPEATQSATAAQEPQTTDTPVPEPETASEEMPAVRTTFVISSPESEARFRIDEELLGKPVTVVGATNALAGELTVDPANPPASVIGQIRIDASTLLTDNGRRNGAIRRFILQTNLHRFITFDTTAIMGLPDVVSVGDEIQFEIAGDLTVRDVTAPALFSLTLQVVSESELRGSASTVLARETFNLTIPRVPSVANVGEEFGVEFDFVARAE